MRTPNEGLKNEALQAALQAALTGRPQQLEELLGRYGGGGPSPRPNLRLAAAFGTEMQALADAGVPATSALSLLQRLGANDAAPDTPEAFLPIAAAHGWTGRLRARQDIEPAWAALAELAADERAPVRIGTLDALVTLANHRGGANELLARALTWLDLEDREGRYRATALVMEALADRKVLSAIGDHRAILAYLSRVIEEVAGAPRAAERSDGRRRLLLSFARTFASVVTRFAGGDLGADWLEAECQRARHPDVRKALSDAVLKVRATSEGLSATTIERLRRALEGSAKPPRDPSRIRPGHGRGKATRGMR